MKATLSFTLPEERQEFLDHVRGPKAIDAINEMAQTIFRPARKHGYENPAIQNLLNALDDLVDKYASEVDGWPMEIYGSNSFPKNATCLIELLEKEFFEIKEEYGITEE